jgi:hypothetical protein
MLKSLGFILIIIISIVVYFIDQPPVWVLIMTVSPMIATTILSLIVEKKTCKEKFDFFGNTAGYIVIFCAIFIPGLGAYLLDDFLKHNNIITKFDRLMLFPFAIGFTYVWIYTGILLAISQTNKKEIEKDPQI